MTEYHIDTASGNTRREIPADDGFDDLPPHLQRKLRAAFSAANAKTATPKQLRLLVRAFGATFKYQDFWLAIGAFEPHVFATIEAAVGMLKDRLPPEPPPDSPEPGPGIGEIEFDFRELIRQSRDANQRAAPPPDDDPKRQRRLCQETPVDAQRAKSLTATRPEYPESASPASVPLSGRGIVRPDRGAR